MYTKSFFPILLGIILSLSLIEKASSCELCTIPRLGRDSAQVTTESGDKKWFFKYSLEEQNWHEKEAREAHNLHHAGHHFHDKTREQFHHLTLGNHFADRFTFISEIPYVMKHSIEIDDHSILGTKQKSEGLGDLQLVGDYRLIGGEEYAVSLIGGVKFPTGSTEERNSVGTLFEPELQPGTGSLDYITGAVYQRKLDRIEVITNVIYVIKTEGEYDFESGDLFSTSVLAEYALNPQAQNFRTKIGIDANLQFEQKQKSGETKIADSGGTTLLLGPIVTVQANDNVALVGSFLAPAYQNLGGVHQELDFIWTVGGKVSW